MKVKKLLLLLFLLVFMSSCSKKIDKNMLEREEIEVDYSFDVSDMRLIVGFSDYFFIGEIVEDLDTVYLYGEPYTKYKAKIIKNIKGDLPEEVTFFKWGGVTKRNTLLVPEGGDLPEEGYIYAISAVVRKDGNLYVSGANSSIIIKENKDSSYSKYFEYYHNEVAYDRERFTYNKGQ